MRKRNNRIWCRLNDEEYKKFQRNVEKTGLPQEAYLRKLINGIQPKESPPIEYYQLLRKLNIISTNINQVTVKLHATGLFEKQMYEYYHAEFMKVLLSIQRGVE